MDRRGWTLSTNELTNTENILSITQYFAANTTYTFTVKLYVISRDNTSTPIENRSSLETASSSDYFSLSGSSSTSDVTFDGNFSKYIVAVNGESVGDRSSYTSDIAKANPVTVQSGDVVTYKIEVDNTSNSSYVDTISVTIQDTMESGLEAYGNSDIEDGTTSFTYTFNNIKAGTSATYEFNVLVTKSDMYLLPIENEALFVSGTYYKRQNDTWTYNVEDIEGLSDVQFNYVTLEEDTIESSDITDVGSSDYVQLDDVVISGDVWLDSDEDGIMDDDESKIQGVVVYLYSSRTNPLLDTNGISYDTSKGAYYVTTDSNGHYSFGKVKKGDTDYSGGTRKYTDNSLYSTYYLEYEYLGTVYESTEYSDGSGVTDTGYSDSNWASKSHACESNVSETNRQDFNELFETVAYNTAYSGDSSDNTQTSLVYDKDGHTSTLTWTDSTTITSKSMDLYLSLGTATDTYTTKVDYVNYLQHMNLGLVERPQTDLELTKDVVSAYVTINGKETTYEYNALGTDGYNCEYYLSTPYELKIYNEDYSYRASSYSDSVISSLKSGTELEITLTYKITITNKSEGYYNVIREIIDISSDEMTLCENGVYSYNDEGEKIYYNASEDSIYYDENDYSYTGYNTCFITGFDDVVLGSGDKLEIYLDYTVNKDNDDNIVTDSNENDLGKVNIAQIGAFSTYDDEALTTPSGVVDKDSNPGNIVDYDSANDFNNYEDDIFYTTILILLRDGDDALRNISGNVWEDLETEENYWGQNYGDGLKDEENGAANVTVRLMEVVSGTATNESGGTYSFEYLVDTGISSKTDASGNYTLKDEDNLHAGTYIVRFIYCDNADDLSGTGDTIKYSGQDYKSTTYTNVGDTDDETEIVEATAFTEAKDDAGKEISVARDNELRRLEVISYSTTMNYTLDTVLKANDEEDKQTLAENTGMYADTLSFNMQIEYYDNYNDKTNFKINGLNTYEYKVKDVDFGLIERPQTKLKLMNDMTEMIATASNGSELVHLYFDITYYLDDDGEVQHTSILNETKSTGYNNVQILNRTSTQQGFRYVNIDSQYLQGMTIKVKYQLAVVNIGDIDTSSQNLVDIVENDKLENVVDYLKTCTSIEEETIYSYNVDSDNTITVSDNMLLNYSYTELNNAIDELNDSDDYSSYVNGESYKYGYFLGETYYADRTLGINDDLGANDAIVETRVDQIVDYVDPDLVFVMLDNTNESGSPKFVSYTIEAIAEKGLLAGVTEDTVRITDGSESYIDITDNTENNLVFSTESETINSGLYKYLKPVYSLDASDLVEKEIAVSSSSTEETSEYTTATETKTVSAFDEEDLYVIDIQGSKVLSSENDELFVENISEIVKVTNTVGRKVYVSSDVGTGSIGNSTISTTTTSEETGSGSSDNSDDSDNPEEIVVSVTTIRTAGESDTDYAEYTSISAPTGLSIKEQKEMNVVKVVTIITASLACVCAILIIVKIIKNRKRFYR